MNTVDTLLNELTINELTDRDKQRKLGIVVVSEGKIGPTPTVEVKQASFGFDWDSQTFLIFPEKPLTALNRDEVDAISKSVKDSQSFHTLQIVKAYANRETELRNFIKSLDQSSMTDEQKEFVDKLR
jgi:hypothetical protein